MFLYHSLFLLFYCVFFFLQELSVPKSKYEEDVYINNHTSVWGSWWKDHQWGYRCCQQTVKNSYCTGVAGIEAAEEAAGLMRSNIERHATASNGLEQDLILFLFLIFFFCVHNIVIIYECDLQIGPV